MIITADLHLREDSADTVLREVLPGIFQACLDTNDRDVAILGDLLHFRYKVDARIQNAVKDELKRWVMAGINVRIIPGNHDQYEVSGRNALELFAEIPGVKVYSVPTWDADGLWIPYRKDPREILEALAQDHGIRATTPRTLFMHHGIKGAWMNDRMQDTEGLDLAALAPDRWQAILCGHYHRHQQVGRNLWYIGSPWQTTANEAGQAKGFVVWKGTVPVQVERLWGPRFHRFELQAGQSLDLRGVSPRDEVRVKTVGAGAEAAAAVLGKQLVEAGLTHHVVTPEVAPLQARLTVPAGATLEHYAQAYVGQTETDLDKAKLMAVYRELTT
jgi:DNA repair exonuclease SbcCD nuclease subunit